MKTVLVFLFALFSLSAFSQSSICFHRLHQGYAEVLIPVSQWNGSTVTLNVYYPNGAIVAGPVTYTTTDLPKVTGSGGAQYYYLKGAASAYGTATLIYKVSSPVNAAVSDTLAPLQQSQWNTAGTAAVCGVSKAGVCFNRLHQGYAEMLIPVSQWHDTTVTLKIYHPNGTLIASLLTCPTSSLTKVTGTGGAQYYYLKGINSGYGAETLTYEVSSARDAAVSNTLDPLQQSQWSTAGTAAVCGVSKAGVCFNRLHQGYAEMLIPVSQWHDTTVTLKIYHPNGTLIASLLTCPTSSLTKATGTGGAQYYYLKGINSGYGAETLTYEVSSTRDAAVSNTLDPLQQSQWSTAGTAAVCGVSKAGVCFNRLHQGYAEMLIPVSQWHDTTVTLRIYHPNSNLIAAPLTYPTSSLTKVTGTGGAQYYYLKGINSSYGAETLTYEVSSARDAAVSNTLAPLADSLWNNVTLQNTCINKPKGMCVNRSNASYTIYLQKSEWTDTSVTLKLYHSNGVLLTSQLFTGLTSTLYNNVPCYKVSTTYASYANENIVVEVSGPKTAALHMYVAPVQQLCYPVGQCTTPVTPAFAQIAPVCKGSAFTLPGTSSNGITGTWAPAVNNQATTTYTFTPAAGQCAGNAAMTVTVKADITWTSGSTGQTVAANTPLANIVYTLPADATATTVTGLPAGVTYTVSGTALTISGTPSISGTFSYTVSTTTSCGTKTAAGSITVTALAADWTRAPNSYIFTGKDAAGNNVEGLYIPVKKAYAMWADTGNAELSLRSSIPAGSIISAYVYWEDVSGIIKTDGAYKLTLIGSGENAKIKVMIDKGKGKGNALVSLHAGANGNSTDPIYWSWHVWVTDDVAANGSTYRQGYETDKNRVPFSQVTNRDGSPYKFQWMNRNLGATNTEFLGNDWNKSAGLMYQWGRKDPIPPLVYKDATAYEINGAAGTFRFQNFTQNTTSPFGWTMRPYNTPNSHTDVSQNIGYSVRNPLKAITFLERYGQWFSDQPYKVAGSTIYNIVNWDLWSDNRRGLWSRINTSDTAVAADTKSYELKSAYDPCPCGWRVPSHYGNTVPPTEGNNVSPWGRNGSWANDDLNSNSKFYLDTVNAVLSNVKVYPSLGFDFTQQSDRNIGVFPISGAYVFVGPNEAADYYSATARLGYINWLSTAGAHTATLSVYDNASENNLGFVSDFYKFPTQSKYRMSVSQHAPAKGAGTVRCMSDPNDKYLGNFATEFISEATSADIKTLTRWTKDANSYIVMTNTDTVKRIKLRKAYAMYKLYLSETGNFPQGIPSAGVYWTTNANLITNVSMAGSGMDSSEMVVTLRRGQNGNAVVALRSGSTGTDADPVIWSWHIWAPETMPSSLPVYKTENKYQPSPSSGHIVNPTNNCISPPLETVFMDRNLGALIALPTSTGIDPQAGKKAMGLQYQWGRKDPLPSFLDQATIVKNGATVSSSQYNSNYTKVFSVYGAGIAGSSEKRYVKIGKMLRYAVENPLTYLFNDGAVKDWISNESGLSADRWGHATGKSPFDPCPDGWRIPDVSFAFLSAYNTQVSTGVKGTSPWYQGKVPDPKRTDGVMGIDQIWDSGTDPVIINSASQSYKGMLATYTDGSGWAGWIFNDPSYAIGNYPVTGIRGNLGTVAVANNFPRIGVWTASLGDAMAGNAIGLSVRYAKMATGLGFEPHLAMSCRCAKMNFDANGNEIGRYDPNAIPVPQGGSTARKADPITAQEIDQMASGHKIIVFPNPVKDVLRIQADDTQTYYYQIYNMAGQMVQQGTFDNKQTDISSLPPGAYLVRINNAESVVKIIKQ